MENPRTLPLLTGLELALESAAKQSLTPDQVNLLSQALASARDEVVEDLGAATQDLVRAEEAVTRDRDPAAAAEHLRAVLSVLEVH